MWLPGNRTPGPLCYIFSFSLSLSLTFEKSCIYNTLTWIVMLHRCCLLLNARFLFLLFVFSPFFLSLLLLASIWYIYVSRLTTWTPRIHAHVSIYLENSCLLRNWPTFLSWNFSPLNHLVCCCYFFVKSQGYSLNEQDNDADTLTYIWRALNPLSHGKKNSSV